MGRISLLADILTGMDTSVLENRNRLVETLLDIGVYGLMRKTELYFG